MNISAERTLHQAKKYIVEHKQMISNVVQGVEAFAAPLVVGIAEGRLATDGSGHVQVAGVPLSLLLGAIGVVGGASGYLDEYGTHATNMGCGLLGAYGADLGRQLGLGMRLSAGKAVQKGALNPTKVAEITAKKGAKEAGWQPQLTEPAGVRVGGAYPEQYVAMGAAPGALSPDQLNQLVQAAASAP